MSSAEQEAYQLMETETGDRTHVVVPSQNEELRADLFDPDRAMIEGIRTLCGKSHGLIEVSEAADLTKLCSLCGPRLKKILREADDGPELGTPDAGVGEA